MCPIESWHLPVSTFVHEVCDELRCGSLPVIHRVPIGLNNVNNPSIETKKTILNVFDNNREKQAVYKK